MDKSCTKIVRLFGFNSYLLGLLSIHKNKPANSEVLAMDEIEKIIREIMAEKDCGPLYALYILSKMLEAE